MFSANENIQLRHYKRRVVEYVEATLPPDLLDLGVNVMAMQVNCKAPGCVPIETAIIIVFPASESELLPGLPESAGGGSYKTKVLLPMSDVTRDDVLAALPPAFSGGTRSMERLCVQARDVMLGQITQLFGDSDVAGRRLMAEYLQSTLQAYVDADCQPPEWGQPFPSAPPVTTTNNSITAISTPSGVSVEASTTEPPPVPSFAGTGNIVLRRPIDEEVAIFPETELSTNSVHINNSYITPSAQPSRANDTISLVDTVVKRRQQQAAVRTLLQHNNTNYNNSGSSTHPASLLSQLSSREHAPGIRRPGCPCCDPDSASNVFDKLLSQV